ncbi:MAG: FAD-dependent oxidoreductase [Proteobacteria bacterium]|nr:FAD-dependent oxidoreductase [Pseudomonadota bacterium]
MTPGTSSAARQRAHRQLRAVSRAATAAQRVLRGGDLSKELESRGELEAFAREELRGIFGARIDAQLASARSTAWGGDPFSLGSGSAARPGHADARAALAQPVAPNLCFAGEACSAPYYGTLHGAWPSGQAAAEPLL